MLKQKTLLEAAEEIDDQIHDMVNRLKDYDDPSTEDSIESLIKAHQNIRILRRLHLPKD